jgi:hypothetical protein
VRSLVRLGAWGCGATLALILTVLALQSDIGAQRLAAAYNTTQTAKLTSDAVARLQPNEETRRLAEVTRNLATDRDRLLARLTVLERNLEDVTGSIRRAPETAAAKTEAAGPTTFSTAMTSTSSPQPIPLSRPGTIVVPPRAGIAPAAPLPQIASAPATIAAEPETTQSIATTSEFGVDIGGGASLEALRDLWGAARNNHGAALQNLRPVIAVREGEKGIELRLVAGPLNNAGAAAKICASLASGGWACKPAVFDGQKLSVR